jgi:NAD(P)-dependent dehydrogenase (short-subunit alcohol dehydrogenase family)
VLSLTQRYDVFVHIADIPAQGQGDTRLRDSTSEEWHRGMQLNVYGLTRACLILLPAMIARGFGRMATLATIWTNGGSDKTSAEPVSVSAT